MIHVTLKLYTNIKPNLPNCKLVPSLKRYTVTVINKVLKLLIICICTHYFRAICWNQGSVVRQEVETCFGVT